MRLKLFNLVTILLLAGSSDGRPQQVEVSTNLQSATVGNDDTEGWRPLQHDAKIAQKSISVDKDLPQIVEGNSRYTEEKGARRRESYLKNNPFYQDQITIFGNEKISDMGLGPLDLETFEAKERFKRSNPLEGIGQRINDEVMIGGSNSRDVKIASSHTVGRNKTEGTPIAVINLKTKDVMVNGTADDTRNSRFIIDDASTNMKSNISYRFIRNFDNTDPFLEDKNVSDADKRPANIQRKKISSSYTGQMKSSPLLLEHVSNVDFLLYLNRNTSSLDPRVLGNESQTRMDNLSKIRPQVTPHSRNNSDGYKPIHVNREKVMNFFKILPTQNDLKNFTDKATFSQSNLHNLHDIHNQVFGMGPDNSKIEIKLVGSNSNEIGNGVQRLALNQTRKHEFKNTNSTKNRIRIKPQPNEASGLEYSKISLRIKPNSSQSIPDLNLKNWPNENFQNIEDLYNYQKYTSFHNGDENLETQETSDDLNPHETPSNVHKVTKKPDKKQGPKPSVIISDHSSARPQTVQNSKVGTTTSYDPETHVNLDQSGHEVVQWEQIHQITSNNTDFLTDRNTFDSIPEGLEPNRPINPDHEQSQSSNYHGYVDEISTGQNPLVQITNYDQASVQDEEYYQNQQDQQTFDYPNLENDFDPADVTRPTSGTDENDGTYSVYQNDPVHTPDPSEQPYFNPLSVVSQNTVVHILNAGEKRPNITVTEMKVTRNNSEALLNLEEQPADDKNSSASTPNVHIMFTTDEDQDESNRPQYALTPGQRIPEVTYDEGINCPTIKINSYTRINNTIQGKEGCTDLNIIINSHVLNTNVFNPTTTSTGNYALDDKLPSNRYPGNGQPQPSFDTSDGSYVVPSGGSYGMYPTESGQNTGGLVPGDLQDFPLIEGQNSQVNIQDSQFDQQSPGTSTFEVFQQTQINIGSQDDVPSSGDALDPGVSNDSISPGDEVGTPETGVSNDPIIPAEVANDPVIPTEVADDPGATGVGTPGGGTPSFPPFSGIDGPLADTDPAEVAADAPSSPASGGSSGIQFPGGSNPLSGITNQLSDAVGNLGSQSGDAGGGNDDDDDDDDGDDDDDDLVALIPFSIIESAMSILPYFTLLNPLNYGFLSIAISPFAVAVAGLFGLAAAFVPFALPSVFNFGRSADQDTITLKPSLEEVVTRSIEQYENWNEWKSKRKKRKR